MIYLSGVKGGTYPISRRLPPSAGRFARWDWARYFRIMHSLASTPYSAEAFQQAVYAFQNLPPDMVFSDPISTAAWARFQELYQTRGRDVVLNYMLRLPRMTRRYNPDDTRNWYDVEKEWQRSEAAQPENLAGLDDLGVSYPAPPPFIEPPLPPPPVIEPPPPPPAPPPVIEHPIVPAPRVVVTPAPPLPGVVPPPEVLPDSAIGAQVDRIIAEHVTRGTQSQIEASLSPAQIAYLDRTQPGWRAHLRETFPEALTPEEKIEERIFETEPTKLRMRIDEVISWAKWEDYIMPRYSISPIAMPVTRFESIVTSVWEAVRPKITWDAVGVALRNRGFYPAGEGVRELYIPRFYEKHPVRRGIELYLKGKRWYGRMYPLTTPTGQAPRTISNFERLVRLAYEAASSFNRLEYGSEYSFTAQDVRGALMSRGLLPEAPEPAVVPTPPTARPPAPAYDPETREPASVREAFLEVLSDWRGYRYAQVRTKKGSIPYFTKLARRVYNRAREINRAKYDTRHRFTYFEVRRCLYKRNYARTGTAPAARPEPPVAPPVVMPPAPVVHARPVVYDRMEELPPIREAIDSYLKNWLRRRWPYVASEITRITGFYNLLSRASRRARSYNNRNYGGRYRFTASDVRKALEGRGYRSKAWKPAAAPGPAPPPAPPPKALTPTVAPIAPPPRPLPLPAAVLPPPVQYVAPYDRMEEMPPIREAIDFTLKDWRGFRFAYVAAKPTPIIAFQNLVHTTHRRAKTINSREYDNRYKFNRGDVRRALEGRRYRPSGWRPAGISGLAAPPAPPPIAGLGSTGYYVTIT